MNFQVDKFNVALEHVDWAIKLLLDHKAYTASITLAAVAEELIGKSLGDNASQKILTKRLAEKLSDHSMDEKTIRDSYINRTKNLFKHWHNSNPKTIELELESEAIQYIIRAINNFISFDRSIPSEAQRFLAWVKANRTDIWSDGLEKLLQGYG